MRPAHRPLVEHDGQAAVSSDPEDFRRLAGEMVLEILRRTHLSGAPELAVVLAEEARRLGIDPLVLYLLDHEQRCLVPVPAASAEDREVLPVQGTMAGRAFS